MNESNDRIILFYGFVPNDSNHSSDRIIPSLLQGVGMTAVAVDIDGQARYSLVFGGRHRCSPFLAHVLNVKNIKEMAIFKSSEELFSRRRNEKKIQSAFTNKSNT